MKKQKGKKKTDEVKVFESTYLAAITRNQELVIENNLLSEEIARLRSSATYHVRLKMYTDCEVKTWDFSAILKMIQFESPQLLVKILRAIHHSYSILNIQEQVRYLNEHKVFCGSFSESIPNEITILKELADNIEAIKSIDV